MLSMGKFTISMVIFNSKLLNYQRVDPKFNGCLVCKFKEKADPTSCVCKKHTNSSPPQMVASVSLWKYPPGFHPKTKVGGSFQLSPQTTCRYSRCPRPAKRGQVRRRFPFSPGAAPRHHPANSMAIFHEIQETPRCTGFICMSEISQGLLLIFTHHTFLDPKNIPWCPLCICLKDQQTSGAGATCPTTRLEPRLLELATVSLVSWSQI